MALPKHKTCISILRSILGPGAGSEARFAEKIGRSTSWLKKASCGQIPLTRDAATVIAYETGISSSWLLEGDVSIPPHTGDYQAYTQETYALYRTRDRDDHDFHDCDLAEQEFTGCVYALTQILRASIEKNRGGLFTFHLSYFVDEMNKNFGKAEIYKNKFGPNIAKEITVVLASEPAKDDMALQLLEQLQKLMSKQHKEGIKKLKQSNRPKPKPQKKQPSRKSERPA